MKNYFTFFYFAFLIPVIILTGCGKKETPHQQLPEVKYMTVFKHDVPVKSEWVGQTLGREDVEIKSRVDGYVEGIYFTEGTFVQKGQLLYTLDAKDLEQQVANANAKLSEARTLLVQAEADVNRYTPLAQAGAVSQRTLEIALSTYEARKSEVASAEAGLRLAQINHSYSRIYSPITGLIGISNFQVGDYVGKIQTSPLNTVSNINPIDVKFSISEQEYLSLIKRIAKDELKKQEEKAELEMILSNGEKYDYPGRINIAQRQVDVSTGTLQIRASFPNPDNIIRPGQFAKIRTTIEVLKDAVLVPNVCITELQGQFQVFVIGDEGKVQLRIIKAGPKYGNFRVVESGITNGEKVITEGMLKIRPDMIVKGIDDTTKLDSLLKSGGF